MDPHRIRKRIKALITALETADVRSMTITLNDVTPEQLVEAYPEAKIERYVSHGPGDYAVAIDSARVPSHRDIEASRHRKPTPDELAEVRSRPYDSPGQHCFLEPS